MKQFEYISSDAGKSPKLSELMSEALRHIKRDNPDRREASIDEIFDKVSFLHPDLKLHQSDLVAAWRTNFYKETN